MRSSHRPALLILLLALLVTPPTPAQTTWEDLQGRFVLDLPTGWRQVPSWPLYTFEGPGGERFYVDVSGKIDQGIDLIRSNLKTFDGISYELVPVEDATCMEMNSRPACWGFFRGEQIAKDGTKTACSVVIGVVTLDDFGISALFRATGGATDDTAWERRLFRVFQTSRRPEDSLTGVTSEKRLSFSAKQRSEDPTPEDHSSKRSIFGNHFFSGHLPPDWEQTYKYSMDSFLSLVQYKLRFPLITLEYEPKMDWVECERKGRPPFSFYEQVSFYEKGPNLEVFGQNMPVDIYQGRRDGEPGYVLAGVIRLEKGCFFFVAFSPKSESFKEILEMVESVHRSTSEDLAAHARADQERDQWRAERSRKIVEESQAIARRTLDAAARLSARGDKPLWRARLGAALVDEMAWLGPGRILVGLREYSLQVPNQDLMLLDAASGNVVWRYPRENRKNALFRLLDQRPALLLFSVENEVTGEEASNTLLALDSASGRELWTANFKERGRIGFSTDGKSDFVLVEKVRKEGILLAPVNLSDGKVRWEKAYRIANPPQPKEKGQAEPVSTLPAALLANDVWNTSDGIERLAGADGQSRWTRRDVRPDDNSPPLLLDQQFLFVVDGGRKLHALDPASGATRWAVQLPPESVYTDLQLAAGRIYARGLRASGSGDEKTISYQTVAVSTTDFKIVWTDSRSRASLSNLLEHDGCLYFGTDETLVSLDLNTGMQIFEKAAGSGNSVIRVSAYPDRIVYVGERDVAAFKPETADVLFPWRFSPPNGETTFRTISDEEAGIWSDIQTIAEIQGGSKNEKGQPASTQKRSFDWGKYAQLQVAAHQNRASAPPQPTGFAQSSIAVARFQHSAARTDAMGALMVAALTTAEALRKGAMMDLLGVNPANIRPRFRRVKLMRKILFATQAANDTDDYAVRVHREALPGTKQLVLATLIHLPTGKRRDTYLSLPEGDYGLWNFVDLERGVIYHHGIGLNLALHVLGPERPMSKDFKKARAVESLLLAAPIRVPK